MPGSGRAESVFLGGFLEPPAAWRDEALAARFEQLLAVRAAVMKAIEEARQGGMIRQASEARVVLGAADADGLGTLLGQRLPELAPLFLTSAVELGEAGNGAASPVVPGLRVEITRAAGEKCPRCWRVRPVGVDARHPELCTRCAEVVG
jgi:isoleucyl-tRNA synthetase